MNLWGAAMLLVVGSACTESTGPQLDSAIPAAASAGAIITIRGKRLCGENGNCETAGGAIRIGYDSPVIASIVDYTDTSAQVQIPPVTPIGRTVLIATVNDHASNALDFVVLAP